MHFNYKSNEAVDLKLAVNGNASSYKIASLSAASDWTDYSFDLGMLISKNSWTEISSIELFIGEKAGTEISFTDFYIRTRNDSEASLASAMFLEFASPSGATLTDLTEMFSYTNGLTQSSAA